MARSAIFTLLLSLAAVIAYLGYRAFLRSSEPPPQTSQAVVAPTQILGMLPEFSLDDLDGNTRSIRSWPQHALVINFWATWCAPCLREIPLLKEFQEQNADYPVQVIGIAIDNFEAVQNFAEDMNFNYPILVGESDAMNAAGAFGVEFFALPFTVFSDKRGRILGVHTGEILPEDLQKLRDVLSGLANGVTNIETARALLSTKP
jgi:thiol-disulfide isomerase/thioredoxin